MKVSIDFETYSEEDINKLDTWAYAAHPTTEMLCLSWSYDGRITYLWYPGASRQYGQDLVCLFNFIEKGGKVYAWKADFEYHIWNKVCVAQHNWPSLPIDQLYDTMAIAQSKALPGALGRCGEALQMDIQKDSIGERLIPKLCSPRKPSKHNPITRWAPENNPDDFELLYKYCRKDVLAEHAIYERLKNYELSPMERALWLDTHRMNDQGIPVDVNTSRRLIKLTSEYAKTLTEDLNRITIGEVQTSGQIEKIRQYIKFWDGIETEDLSADTVSFLLRYEDLSPTSRRVLEIRQALSRTSTKKYHAILNMADENGRVHDVLRYHQATTGRWGGNGIQPHNFPRKSVDNPDLAVDVIKKMDNRLIEILYDNPFELATQMLRPIITAEDGHRLIVSDFSGIENRTLCWLADDFEALRLFEQGVDQYKWFATKLYPGTRYDDVTDAQRSHAKTCILGLGYGMGVDKFMDTCLRHGMETTRKQAERDVCLYRDVYADVVRFWHALYRTAIRTVADGVESYCGRITFKLEDGFLNMILPSGRSVSYYQPEIRPRTTPWGETKPCLTFMGLQPQTYKWVRLDTIPGRLVENATQAVARDLLGDAQLRLRMCGYNVLFSVHDEVVIDAPYGYGTLDDVNMIMARTDAETYPGLPIEAEGYESERYKKG